ncbi:DUF3624 domain-containing protein [Psychromonas sp. KJ10-10]|uniref:DUF3624 domain-containing protein n=1 Tax=Psychromonas sp. KJ10-10 TaxID=3391823 RepID=UPI0039B449C4
MACAGCEKSIWKQKLGRCKRCMWLNFMLLVASSVFAYFMWQAEPKSVQTIAMLFAFFSSALLMLLHVIAFLYYHFFKADKHNLK